MQPGQPRPRARLTTSAQERLREEVHNDRERILQAATAITGDLPQEAGGCLDPVEPGGYPNCFPWSRQFLHRGTIWRLTCMVSKQGWPDILWVVDVIASP